MQMETIYESKAYVRGYERGMTDRELHYINDAPLSGEWAGESIRELLGDLTDAWVADARWTTDAAEAEDILCDWYEQGYTDGNRTEGGI